MSRSHDLYRAKLTTPAEAVTAVPRTCNMDTQFIVTEYGVCDLRGKSTTERALGLIDIAHPQCHEELLAQAKELRYVT